MTSLEQEFADWVRKQDPSAEYNYEHPGRCALCRFLRDAGMAREPRVVPTDWRDGLMSDVRHPLPKGLNAKLAAWPWTFGALAERLASLSAAPVMEEVS